METLLDIVANEALKSAYDLYYEIDIHGCPAYLPIDTRANYIAQDNDGIWFAYVQKPIVKGGYWACNPHQLFQCHTMLIKTRVYGDWQDTLYTLEFDNIVEFVDE